MTKLQIRFASPSDAERMAYLAEHFGGFKFEDWEIDWTRVGNNWLVAVVEGEIQGALQVVPSQPIGHIEFLLVDSEMGLLPRTRIVKALLYSAVSILKGCGSQLGCGTIPFDLPSYRAAVVERGWVPINQCEMMIQKVGS